MFESFVKAVEERRKIIEKAFGSSYSFHLNHYFWLALLRYAETANYIFEYVETKVDKDKKDEVLVDLLTNLEKLDNILKLLAYEKVKTPENITLSFKFSDLTMSIADSAVKEEERNSKIIGVYYEESYFNVKKYFKNIDALQEAFIYLKSNCADVDEKIYNLAKNVGKFNNIKDKIYEITELEDKREDYIYLIYKNSHVGRLFILLKYMVEFNLVSRENLDRLFSKDLSLLSSLFGMVFFKTSYEASSRNAIESQSPSPQEIFDVLLENIEYYNKAAEIYINMSELPYQTRGFYTIICVVTPGSPF